MPCENRRLSIILLSTAKLNQTLESVRRFSALTIIFILAQKLAGFSFLMLAWPR